MSETLRFGPPVISIDVEDWPQSTWDRSLPITERSAENTLRVLEILARHGVKATMFILGKFAQAFPSIVREICKEGHEIACHGYDHTEIFLQSREAFRKDVMLAKDILENIAGEKILGYRAPDFSITRTSLWALEELSDLGFDYDSSIFPVERNRYGIPEWPLNPIRVSFPGNKSIVEFPLGTYKWLKRNWPVGGGGYHRLYPGFFSRYVARKVMKQTPFVFYCHPYEFDYKEFREIPNKIPIRVRLHQGLGRRWFESRFSEFLRKLGGQRIKDILHPSAENMFSVKSLPDLVNH
jgi:polysaccharide deacetylase family protein (PEP-CTERM system associated)